MIIMIELTSISWAGELGADLSFFKNRLIIIDEYFPVLL